MSLVCGDDKETRQMCALDSANFHSTTRYRHCDFTSVFRTCRHHGRHRNLHGRLGSGNRYYVPLLRMGLPTMATNRTYIRTPGCLYYHNALDGTNDGVDRLLNICFRMDGTSSVDRHCGVADRILVRGNHLRPFLRPQPRDVHGVVCVHLVWIQFPGSSYRRMVSDIYISWSPEKDGTKNSLYAKRHKDQILDN